VPSPPSPAAGGNPTCARAKVVLGRVLAPSPCHLRQWVRVGAWLPASPGTGDPEAAVLRSLLVMCSSHGFKHHIYSYTFSPSTLQNQRKSPDSSKFFTSENGALPESMNPCRDFTFAIDFMREMLSYSGNI